MDNVFDETSSIYLDIWEHLRALTNGFIIEQGVYCISEEEENKVEYIENLLRRFYHNVIKMTGIEGNIEIKYSSPYK